MANKHSGPIKKTLTTRTLGILAIASEQMNVTQESAVFSELHSILSWLKHNFMKIEWKFLTKRPPTDTGIHRILQNHSDTCAHILNILPQGLQFFENFFSTWKFLATEAVCNEINQNHFPLFCTLLSTSLSLCFLWELLTKKGKRKKRRSLNVHLKRLQKLIYL